MSDDFGSYVNVDVILSKFDNPLEYKVFVDSFAEEKMNELEESLWR
jgi:hypothetical protein